MLLNLLRNDALKYQAPAVVVNARALLGCGVLVGWLSAAVGCGVLWWALTQIH